VDRAGPAAVRALAAIVLVACTRPRVEPLPDPPVAPASAAAPAKPKLAVLPAAEDTGALSAIRAARVRARGKGRVLVVYVGATWCEPCRAFKREIASGALDERLGKVDLLTFDADRDLDRLKAAGYTYRFVPYVALPGADGALEEQREATGKGAEAWRELLVTLDGWQR